MVSSVADTFHANPVAPPKVKQIWMFIHEFIFKEFGACLKHTWNRLVYVISPNKYGLNARSIEKGDGVAKVVLLLHGSGAHPSSFFPLARSLERARIRNVYTVSLDQTEQNPVPVAPLANRIDELSRKYLANGYSSVNFTLIGHSLGALVSAKYIWRVEHSNISKMISLGGRLKYIPNRFWWFCEDVKPEIEQTYHEMNRDPEKVPLYAIWGDRDGLVPKESALIQGNPARELVVKGVGHSGVVFSGEAHGKLVSWVVGYPPIPS